MFKRILEVREGANWEIELSAGDRVMRTPQFPPPVVKIMEVTSTFWFTLSMRLTYLTAPL